MCVIGTLSGWHVNARRVCISHRILITQSLIDWLSIERKKNTNEWMGNGSVAFVREWIEACKVNWVKKPSKCRSNNITINVSIRRMTTTSTTTATAIHRPKKNDRSSVTNEKIFWLYLQNLIIIIFCVHLFAFHLFIHRRLSMNFRNVYEAAETEEKTIPPLSPLCSSPLSLIWHACLLFIFLLI